MELQLNTNFKVTPQGLITFKGNRIAYRRPNELIVLVRARNNFDAADHVIFDALTAKDANKRYIDSFEAEFNWEARFKEFKAGTIPAGISFSATELGAVAALASASDKIKAAFGLPEIPYETVPAINVEKIYTDLAPAARQWLDGGAKIWQLENRAQNNQATNNLVRIKTKSNGVNTIELLGGASIGEKTFKKLWPKVKAAWQKPVQSGTWIASVQGYTMYAYADHIKCGCKSVPRAEVERLAAARGWDNPVPA